MTFQEDASAQTSTGAGPHRTHHHRHGKKPTQWRRNVGSKVVEHAWETLCGSIVQEFIYDTWYASLTPDKEFPAEVRRVLNYAFGQLALRAQRIDLRDVLHDVSELLMEQVELYRDTREMVLSDKASGAAADFNSGVLARRERALRERMAADGNLHPALLQPSGDYKVRMGKITLCTVHSPRRFLPGSGVVWVRFQLNLLFLARADASCGL